VRVTVESKPPVLTGVAKTLDEAEEAFRAKNMAAAKETWQQVLASVAEREPQARAYYGLGRIALAERSPERADQLFRKVLDLEPDPATLSWTLLYLGKLADSQGEADQAKEFYRRALAVAGLPEQVKREAEQGAKGAFYRARPEGAGPADTADDEDDDEDDLP
jgi:tetratricopeptide (TPR) repeat protein